MVKIIGAETQGNEWSYIYDDPGTNERQSVQETEVIYFSQPGADGGWSSATSNPQDRIKY